jgi:hypothetical protein
MKFTSDDRAIVEVTDLREGGDVRGSPLTVIMVLEPGSMKAHTMPRHSRRTSGMLFSGNSHQSREEFKSWPVAREAWSMSDFFHSWIL